MQGEQSSEMAHDRQGHWILIWHLWLPSPFESILFLSCKISCRYLRVSKETYHRILLEKLGLKKFHLR
jgi:hypothetical protein